MPAYFYDSAETRRLDTPHGTLAYREIGPSAAAPLLLLHRFRGTLDHWDPALLEVLAARRGRQDSEAGRRSCQWTK